MICPLRLPRHATSKIQTLEDLQNIASLGFRGEALASIAAVSRLTLASRRTGEKSMPGGYRSKEAHLSQPEPAALVNGTTVEMHDLYFNTPARRKFLKSEATEFSHCEEAFKRIALSRCDIGSLCNTTALYAAVCPRLMQKPASQRCWARIQPQLGIYR